MYEAHCMGVLCQGFGKGEFSAWAVFPGKGQHSWNLSKSDHVVEVSMQIVEVNNLRAFSGSVAPVVYGQVQRVGEASDDCMPGCLAYQLHLLGVCSSPKPRPFYPYHCLSLECLRHLYTCVSFLSNTF